MPFDAIGFSGWVCSRHGLLVFLIPLSGSFHVRRIGPDLKAAWVGPYVETNAVSWRWLSAKSPLGFSLSFLSFLWGIFPLFFFLFSHDRGIK
ncbi:hypothetical protein BJ508DRAFT_79860 [Ascobolus immersus RN42]|uniref:Uncharacterized protein n=1 Tax=Ascobolus immersus RN42 TaxID=1160509 RepID=A0A3N4HCM4_ASCIM|nr:hypothetical protein BJ508DRAFT_79860 [Ascobolus immersus RN42]